MAGRLVAFHIEPLKRIGYGRKSEYLSMLLSLHPIACVNLQTAGAIFFRKGKHRSTVQACLGKAAQELIDNRSIAIATVAQQQSLTTVVVKLNTPHILNLCSLTHGNLLA